MNLDRTTTTVGDLHTHCLKCISWSAIIAGAFVAIGLGFLLNLFGLSIGLSAFTANKEGLLTLAIGGVIGLAIGTIAVMYVSGWVSGYLARRYHHCRQVGMLYGFTTWCVALVATAALASPFSDFLDSYHFALANTASHKIALKHENTQEQTQSQASQGSRNHEANQTGDRENKTHIVTADTEKAVNIMGISLLVTFIIFFLGAFAASLGGYFGIHCREEDKRY